MNVSMDWGDAACLLNSQTCNYQLPQLPLVHMANQPTDDQRFMLGGQGGIDDRHQHIRHATRSRHNGCRGHVLAIDLDSGAKLITNEKKHASEIKKATLW